MNFNCIIKYIKTSKIQILRGQQTNILKAKLTRTKAALTRLVHVTTINHKTKQSPQTQHKQNPKITHEPK